jgi:hypothetical protein
MTKADLFNASNVLKINKFRVYPNISNPIFPVSTPYFKVLSEYQRSIIRNKKYMSKCEIHSIKM